mmetsp:Transcript_5170/g.5975  ORF Transcript_5170/g.5975 Transcript_5170/m.5975 type:complete len:247 (-) Transcript_5170:71-811(-)
MHRDIDFIQHFSSDFTRIVLVSVIVNIAKLLLSMVYLNPGSILSFDPLRGVRVHVSISTCFQLLFQCLGSCLFLGLCLPLLLLFCDSLHCSVNERLHLCVEVRHPFPCLCRYCYWGPEPEFGDLVRGSSIGTNRTNPRSFTFVGYEHEVLDRLFSEPSGDFKVAREEATTGIRQKEYDICIHKPGSCDVDCPSLEMILMLLVQVRFYTSCIQNLEGEVQQASDALANISRDVPIWRIVDESCALPQ